MNRQQLESEAIRLYTQANKNSKWFAQDLADFKTYIKTRTATDLQQSVTNMKCLAGENTKFNKEVQRIENQLEKGGMYDIRNMQPRNAID